MEPERVGRILGVTSRVAFNILRRGISRVDREVNRQDSARPGNNRALAAKGRAATRGAKKFGQAFWAHLTRAGRVLWLEITGLFFALFALFFGQNVYRVHAAWRQGADHTRFLIFAALTAVFAWFSSSSFLRARKQARKPR